MEEDYGMILEGFIDKIHTDFGLKLDIKNIFWRGFCSQGDGLCFDFKLEDKEAFEFLLKLKCENIEHLKDAVNISDVGIEIETVKNSFASHYCHYNTRDINVDIYIKNDADIKNESLFDLYPESFKNLQEEIRVWYVYICKEMYYDLEKHYIEVQDLESEQEDLTFSERVDELIDPEMDIDKIINLIQDASSLDYTKGESYNMIEKFRESFKNDYMIIKKSQIGEKMETEKEKENQSEYYYNKLKNLIFNDDFSKKIGLEKLDNWTTKITKTFIYAALYSNDALEINMKENKDCDIRCSILNAIEINNEIKLNCQHILTLNFNEQIKVLKQFIDSLLINSENDIDYWDTITFSFEYINIDKKFDWLQPVEFNDKWKILYESLKQFSLSE